MNSILTEPETQKTTDTEHRRLDVVIACGDDLDDNLRRTLANVRSTIGPEDGIVLVLDLPREPDGLDADDIIMLDRPLGCGGARHAGIQSSKAEFIAIVDAHMDFPDGWADECIAHFSEHPNDITCAHMQSVDWEWLDYAGQHYAGAHMTELQVAPINEPYPFAARWNRTDIREGEIGCLMGACYAMRRERYHDIGAPLQYLRYWGMDEEMLSISNWIMGGRTWLLPMTARHMFGAPKRTGNQTGLQGAQVWMNRLFAVRSMPMRDTRRDEYENHLIKNTFVNVNWPLISSDTDKKQPGRLRELLASSGRSFEDYMDFWLVTGETQEEIERMKRRTKADTTRRTAHLTPKPKIAPAARPASVPNEPAAVQPAAEKKDKPFPCPHCGWCDINGKHVFLNDYPNKRKRFKCARCAMPFIVTEP